MISPGNRILSLQQPVSPLTSLRDPNAFTRITSLVVVVCFLWLLVYPDLLVAKEASEINAQTQHAAPPAPTPRIDPLSRSLNSLKGQLQTLTAHAFNPLALLDQKPALIAERQALTSAQQSTLNEFAQDLDHIQASNLPESIRERHAQALADYQSKANLAINKLDEVLNETLPAAAMSKAQDLSDWLQEQKTQRSTQPFDPNDLPFAAPDASKTREPIVDPALLRQQMGLPQSVSQIQNGLNYENYYGENNWPKNPIMLASLNTSAGLLAASAVTPPGAQYLAPTEDVQITQAIQDKATELNNNPVEIYNWVRNNIEYLPTYKSIQGSDLTLQTRRGNAFDTASLLIALLRASGIPAKYVYGIVEVPIAEAMNWVGGVQVPQAALQLFGQGGIPNIGLTQGGKFKVVRLEHVWVEAYVDYEPSRGAKNFQGDSWVPLDASFKQYDYTQGLPIQDQVSFDAQAFANQIEAGATINEQEGWVQGIDQQFIQSEFQDYLDSVNDYIDTQNPDATVGEVLGTKTIIQKNPETLAAGLPYQLKARGADFAALPDDLRTYFHYRLYASQQDRAYDDPAIDYKASLPSLANKRITLSFEPATQEDRDTIESYLPEPDENGEIDPNDLPDSLPGYLINLTAQLKIDGEIVASAGPYKMGTEMATKESITKLIGGEIEARNNPIAGEFYAIGLRYQGGQGQTLQAISDRMQTVKTQLENEQFELLTKDGLVGELLNAGAIAYFGALDAQVDIISRSGDSLVIPHPGFGNFSTSLQPQYSYGAPRNVLFAGIGVDIDGIINTAEGRQGNPQTRVNAIMQVGYQASALEHRIPELLFTSDENPGEAASAVKAIAVAQAQGQRIYTIDQSNLNAINALTVSADVKNNIRNGVNAGLVATVHQHPVTISGWTGVGFILVDPQTGAGAYRISSGANGGMLDFGSLNTLFFTTLSALFLLGALVSAVGLILVLLNATLLGAAAAGVLTAIVQLLVALSAFSLSAATGSSLACQIGIGLAVSGILTTLLLVATELLIASATIAVTISILTDAGNTVSSVIFGTPDGACEGSK